MTEHQEEVASGAQETHGRMLRAVREALKRGGGVGRVSGLSLIAVLCASAMAPVALVAPALGPALTAWLATTGAVGSNVLADVILKVVGRWSPDAVADTEAIEQALAGELEAQMAGPGPDAATLREAAATLLREHRAQQVLLEVLAEGNGELQAGLAESMAVLAGQFTEFASIGSDIRRAVWGIHAALLEQLERLRAQGERSREHSRMLSQVLDAIMHAEREQEGGSYGEAPWRDCPYRGLLPYGQRDEQIFHGRKDLTLRLCQALAERLAGGGLLLVTGASGAGKSSLLSAGLIPALSRDLLAPGSGRWPCRMLTPTASPLRELAAHLADLAEQDPKTVLASLELSPERAADLAVDGVNTTVGWSATARDPAASAPRLVLIVDQFEELFTLTSSDDEGRAQRAAFIEALHAAATAPMGSADQPAALVVVSIRGDFLDEAFAHPTLAKAHADGAFVVGPMTESELRSTIIGPAAEAHLRVQPELVDEVIRPLLLRQGGAADVSRAVLPLLSEVMAATWEKRDGGWLTLRAYERAGGVSNAVNNGARSAYTSLEERLQPVARALFLRLTFVTEDGRVVRRRASRGELYRATGRPKSDVDAVITVFAARRLLVLERNQVEIPHDALLQAWSDLQGWLDEDRDERVIYDRLSADAQSWLAHSEDLAYLYPGGRLEEIANVQKRWATDPQRYPASSEVTGFLAAGQTAERERQSAEKARANRLRRMLIGLAVLALVAASTAAAAGIADERASRDDAAVRAETSIAVSRQLAVEALQLDATDPYTARQLAAAAWAVDDTPQSGQTEAALLGEQAGTIITPDRTIYSVAFNPDGTMIATSGNDGSVRLWNPATQQQIGTTIAAAQNAAISHAIFSPDSALLATGSDKGTVSLWNVKTHRQIGAAITATDNGAPVLGLAFNASGTLLATAGADGTVQLWNPVNGRLVGPAIPVTRNRTAVSSVAFSPDGTVLATGDDNGQVRLWNVATRGQVGRAITATTNGAVSAIFNPQGTLLATVGTDGSMRLWNPATRKPVGDPIETPSGSAVLTGAFNPRGTLLATGSADGMVRLWDPATQQQVGTAITATRDKSVFWSVAFNPSGTLLATAGGDGTVRLWNPATQQQVTPTITATANGSPLSDVAFDPSGKLLATADGDGYVRLWDPATQQQVGRDIAAVSNGSPVTDVVFSPSSAWLATAGGDGSVRLWDPATQQQIGTTIPAVSQGTVTSIAFDRSGTTLATGDDRGTVRLWDPRTRQQIGSDIPGTDDGSPVTDVVFSPSSAWLATAGGDGSVRLWNPATQQQIGTTINVHATASQLAFSPSGALMATAAGDGTVRLWNPATQRQIGTTINPSSNSVVWDVAFSPQGDILATADAEGNVRFWNPATGTSLDNGTANNGDGAVLKLAFNPQGTVLATANGNGTSTLINVQQQTEPHRYLCNEFGLPSTKVWLEYVGNSVAEPNTC